MWLSLLLSGRGVTVDVNCERALLKMYSTPATPEWTVKAVADRSMGSSPIFCGNFTLAEQVVHGRPVYVHVAKDYAIWFDAHHAMWFVTKKSKVGLNISSERVLVALNRSTGRRLEQLEEQWFTFTFRGLRGRTRAFELRSLCGRRNYSAQKIWLPLT